MSENESISDGSMENIPVQTPKEAFHKKYSGPIIGGLLLLMISGGYFAFKKPSGPGLGKLLKTDTVVGRYLTQPLGSEVGSAAFKFTFERGIMYGIPSRYQPVDPKTKKPALDSLLHPITKDTLYLLDPSHFLLDPLPIR